MAEHDAGPEDLLPYTTAAQGADELDGVDLDVGPTAADFEPTTSQATQNQVEGAVVLPRPVQHAVHDDAAVVLGCQDHLAPGRPSDIHAVHPGIASEESGRRRDDRRPSV